MSSVKLQHTDFCLSPSESSAEFEYKHYFSVIKRLFALEINFTNLHVDFPVLNVSICIALNLKKIIFDKNLLQLGFEFENIQIVIFIIGKSTCKLLNSNVCGYLKSNKGSTNIQSYNQIVSNPTPQVAQLVECRFRKAKILGLNLS